jgi:hypothetical protein
VEIGQRAAFLPLASASAWKGRTFLLLDAKG